jgi:hypothetical protein
MSQWLFIATTLSILILIAACAPQQTLQAQPLNLTPPKGACEDVVCGANMHCDAGQCLCDGSFKRCGDGCIDERACCTDRDCGPGRSCADGACVERPKCEYLATWDDGRKECVCDEDAKYCQAQGKCIPAAHCCAHDACDDDQRCAFTTYSASVCMEFDTKKCKIVHEGRSLDYFFPQGRYDVQVVNVLEGPLFDLKVNNDSIRRVEIGEYNTVDGTLKIFVEALKVFGGNCREEPD